jgi:homocysteine S-methyltransferase
MTQMKNFVEMFEKFPVVLTEGSMVERIRRHPSVELNHWIAHAGLIYEEKGREVLRQMYGEYIGIGRQYDLPFMALAPSWRANPERLRQSQYSTHTYINRDCVDFLKDVRATYAEYATSIFIGGMMACKGDAYRPEGALSQYEAALFHQEQAAALARSGVDFIKAATLPAMSEAFGIASVLSGYDFPYILSFVIRSEGTLLDGAPIHQAIDSIDTETDPPPYFYMINCVHPIIFEQAMNHEEEYSNILRTRILGFQANTSSKSPEELDDLEYLDTTEPEEFAEFMVALHRRFGIKVLGGCCGSDERHILAIAKRVKND